MNYDSWIEKYGEIRKFAIEQARIDYIINKLPKWADAVVIFGNGWFPVKRSKGRKAKKEIYFYMNRAWKDIEMVTKSDRELIEDLFGIEESVVLVFDRNGKVYKVGVTVDGWISFRVLERLN